MESGIAALAQHFSQKAAVACEEAESATTEEARTRWLKLAREWRALAETTLCEAARLEDEEMREKGRA